MYRRLVRQLNGIIKAFIALGKFEKVLNILCIVEEFLQWFEKVGLISWGFGFFTKNQYIFKRTLAHTAVGVFSIEGSREKVSRGQSGSCIKWLGSFYRRILAPRHGRSSMNFVDTLRHIALKRSRRSIHFHYFILPAQCAVYSTVCNVLSH